ncbi:Acyl-CoA thioesterase, partial [Ancylostoma caninum]
KLAEFPPTFHRIFEARPVNQNIYKPDLSGPLHSPTYHLWVKPVLNVGSDSLLHQYMAAYISDSTMVETAILPHIARGFFVGMAFSLDHCIWFHRTKFDMNDWMLWEQESDFAGHSRTHTRARLWTRDGKLVMTAVQEGVARAPLKE